MGSVTEADGIGKSMIGHGSTVLAAGVGLSLTSRLFGIAVS